MRRYVLVGLAAIYLFGFGRAFLSKLMPDPLPMHRVVLSDPPGVPEDFGWQACPIAPTFNQLGKQPTETVQTSVTRVVEARVHALDDCFTERMSARNPRPVVWLRMYGGHVDGAGINGSDITPAQRDCVERTLKSWRFSGEVTGVDVAFPYPDCQPR